MRQLGQARRPLIALLICVVALTATLLAPVVTAKASRTGTPAVSSAPVAPSAPVAGGAPVAGQPAAAQPLKATSSDAKANPNTATQPKAKATTLAETGRRIAAGSADVMLLAHLIQAEAGIEPYTGKVAVGAVVINRMLSGKFPKTLAGVIYQNQQFEPVDNGTIDLPPSAASIQAAKDAIAGADPTSGALYFFDYRKVSNGYLWSRPWSTTIGTHRFTY